MVYLKKFELLDARKEQLCLDGRTIYTNYYPLEIFPKKELNNIEFDNITIFYGGNGSGKTTLLNIIANKINATRKNYNNRGTIFDRYVNLCDFTMSMDYPYEIKFISSDDIFDYLLDLRAINNNVNRRKDDLSQEWLNTKYNENITNIFDYEGIKRNKEAKTKSMSNYIRNRLVNNNILEKSNGESSLMYWQRDINENGIYILDEPENSLSAENQLKLKKYIEDSSRYYNCQFIISTHSPFLLALEEAKIYDLDNYPTIVKKYYELDSVKTYYNFFKERENDFK